MSVRLTILIFSLFAITACSTLSNIAQVPLRWVGLGHSPAEAKIDSAELLQHISTLASDRFEGRLPGSAGEDLTVKYLIEQFRKSGAQPGNPNGEYIQPVALAGLTAQTDVGMQVKGRPLAIKLQDDVVASSQRLDRLIRVRKSPLVFVGYGVQAPEYQWDDYKGLDVRGKTLLMLVNDPPVVMPGDPDTLDPALFKGRAMTYYGRWTYKYEIAAKLGAAAVLVIHEPGPAGYPWGVVSSHVGGEHFTLDAANGNSDKVAVQGWIRDGKVRELLAAAGEDFDQLKLAARSAQFQPLELPALASFQVRNSVRHLKSSNVVAKVVGTEHPEQVIIYTAHWDHLGRDTSLYGDQIYNGAADNASGTAGLLELAQVFAANPAPRSVVFLAVTAEEQGLLGARYYAQHPLYDLNQTLANINMDAMNLWGKTRDVVLVGQGQNSLEQDLVASAQAQGRRVEAEPTPEKGFYFRSDHFEFARVGVPALYAKSGDDFSDQQAGFGQSKAAQYIREDYHQVSDEVKADWDLSGIVDDLLLLEAVGRRVAAAPDMPNWNPSSEFATARHARH